MDSNVRIVTKEDGKYYIQAERFRSEGEAQQFIEIHYREAGQVPGEKEEIHIAPDFGNLAMPFWKPFHSRNHNL